jgi:hypothetical protein
MPHPYEEHEESPLWRSLDAEIAELEANGDVAVTTAREYVLGALCRRLVRERLVVSSLGVRGAVPQPTTRAAFAAFLEAVADGRSDVREWSELAVTHYPDPAMEHARQRAVQLVAALPVGAVLAPEASDRLRGWARELREVSGRDDR